MGWIGPRLIFALLDPGPLPKTMSSTDRVRAPMSGRYVSSRNAARSRSIIETAVNKREPDDDSHGIAIDEQACRAVDPAG